jgi:ubiquinone/menaquinone biosynthesis C-methylase UbiE
MEDVVYLMESEEESIRLEAKTDPAVVEQQALWAQIRPGMRVADLGCGCGKTTYVLYGLVQPGGMAVGVDVSEKRLEYAQNNYAREGIQFIRGDIWQPLGELGSFDFVWVRFVLEYFRSNGFEIVRNASRILKPGGTLCLIDLDHNCLSHFGLSERLERAIAKCARVLEEEFNFDPYAGRKLYSYLYDLGYEHLAVSLSAHHLIYGALGSVDAFNAAKKLDVVSRKAGLAFDEYTGGSEEVVEEFTRFFSDPRRFSYTPLICARGSKPAHTRTDPEDRGTPDRDREGQVRKQ